MEELRENNKIVAQSTYYLIPSPKKKSEFEFYAVVQFGGSQD